MTEQLARIPLRFIFGIECFGRGRIEERIDREVSILESQNWDNSFAKEKLTFLNLTFWKIWWKRPGEKERKNRIVIEQGKGVDIDSFFCKLAVFQRD